MIHPRLTLLIAAPAALAACDGGDIEINGQKAVPLSEITIAGAPPAKVMLASGDTVILTEGDTFAIKVEGTGTESLRFVRDSELIAVTRENGWSGSSKATIRITMPAPSEIIIGGSGEVEMPALKADTAEVTIGGSGDVAFASDGTVEANIGGAGDIKVSGNAKCTVQAFGSGTLTCTPTSAGASAAIPAPETSPTPAG